MTDLTWTAQRPTKPGWYWYRRMDIPEHARANTMLEVRMFKGKLRVFDDYGDGTLWHPLREYNGQWSSAPISEPKESENGRVDNLPSLQTRG